MEEGWWRDGGGGMGWRRGGGGGVMEKGRWRRYGGGGMVEEGWWRSDGEGTVGEGGMDLVTFDALRCCTLIVCMRGNAKGWGQGNAN